jgi:hypothetical protein
LSERISRPLRERARRNPDRYGLSQARSMFEDQPLQVEKVGPSLADHLVGEGDVAVPRIKRLGPLHVGILHRLASGRKRRSGPSI